MNGGSEKNGVNAVDFFCIGFGAIVGVGWAVSINSWMTTCGGPVPAALGYLLVMLVMVPIALCYCELVPMLPVAGGGMAFAYKAFDQKVGFVSGWMAFCAFVAIVPWEAIQITDVLNYLIPGLKSGGVLYTIHGSDIYLSNIILGVVFSLVLFLINMRGLKSAAEFQRVLCFVLVGAAILGGVAAMIGGRVENLEPVYDVTDPRIYGEGLKQVNHSGMFGGMLAIVATASFFLAGFETIPQGIEEAGGKTKNVGKMVVLSVALACIFYAFLLFAFGLGWDWKEFAVMPRPAAASLFLCMYPGGVGRALYWVLVLGALAGLFTTWNGFFTPSANLLMAMGRGRMLPGALARQNQRNVAYTGQVVVLCLSCMGPFLGPNLVDAITCFSGAAFMLSWSVTAWSLVRLRIKHPEMERPYRIPGGTATGVFAGAVSAVCLIFMFIPGTPFYIGKVAVIMFFLALLVGAVLYAVSSVERRGMTKEELEKGVFGRIM